MEYKIDVDKARKELEEGFGQLNLVQCDDLFIFLSHGSDKHRHWLQHAIYSWSLSCARPEELT